MPPNDFSSAPVGVLTNVGGDALNQGNRHLLSLSCRERQTSHADQLQRQVSNVIHVSGLALVDVALNQLVAHAFCCFLRDH